MKLVGRSSSLFTRVPMVFAYELGVPIELVVVKDLTAMDEGVYGGNPALKIPTLLREQGPLFGAMNITRVIAEGQRVVWPETLTSDLARNAHEMLAHTMGAQIQLIMATMVGKLDGDNVVFAKARRGMEGALAWLDAHVERVASEIEGPSWFENALGCTVEHLAFRKTLDASRYTNLARFTQVWGARESAQATAYRYD